VLTERENTDVTDVDMVVDWILQSTARTLVDERKREI
jgi:hypothetical protein